jgi:hypothetical protein
MRSYAAIPSPERDQRSQSVAAPDDRQRWSHLLAPARTIVDRADFARLAREGSPARRAGKIDRHRLSPSGGVASPADLAIGAGISRVNCTPFLRQVAVA